MSQQKDLRDAMVLRLQAIPGLTVFRAPRRDLVAADLPAASIFGQEDRPASEDFDHQYGHPRIYTVRVELRVSDLVEDDATDSMACLVRQAVLEDDSLGGLANAISWAFQQWDGSDGQDPMAGCALDFNIHYLWRPEWTLS